jgi:uncharacterized protein YjeT (DUF2065 family)
MTEKDLKQTLAMVASLYTKRFAEDAYDRVFQGALGQKLVSLNKEIRLGLEASFYLLTAYFDRVFQEDTPLRKYVKEVALDTAPEVAKRMMNGKVRPELVGLASEARSKEERVMIHSLLKLPDDQLANLLRWVANATEEDRSRLVRALADLPDEQLKRFLGLSPEEKEMLVGLHARPAPKKRSPELEDALRDAHTRVDASLRKQAEKRKG